MNQIYNHYSFLAYIFYSFSIGAYLGAGPLPSQLVHPFQFIDTHESDVYYDTDGRKHMKQIGDEQDITLALEATQGE